MLKFFLWRWLHYCDVTCT